jgi:hypothetical protein
MMAMTTDRAGRRTDPFVRAAFLRAQAGARRRPFEELLEKDDVVSRAIITRAAIAPGSTTGSGFAAELVQNAYPGFLASLKPYSAAARIIAGALQAAIGSAVIGKYPTRAAGPAAPQWVAESGAIPISVAGPIQQSKPWLLSSLHWGADRIGLQEEQPPHYPMLKNGS